MPAYDLRAEDTLSVSGTNSWLGTPGFHPKVRMRLTEGFPITKSGSQLFKL